MSVLECMLIVPTIRQSVALNNRLPDGWQAFGYESNTAGIRAKVVIVIPPYELGHTRGWKEARENAHTKIVPGGIVLDL